MFITRPPVDDLVIDTPDVLPRTVCTIDCAGTLRQELMEA